MTVGCQSEPDPSQLGSWREQAGQLLAKHNLREGCDCGGEGVHRKCPDGSASLVSKASWRKKASSSSKAQ